jgi:hypothetical protein
VDRASRVGVATAANSFRRARNWIISRFLRMIRHMLLVIKSRPTWWQTRRRLRFHHLHSNHTLKRKISSQPRTNRLGNGWKKDCMNSVGLRLRSLYQLMSYFLCMDMGTGGVRVGFRESSHQTSSVSHLRAFSYTIDTYALSTSAFEPSSYIYPFQKCAARYYSP